MAPPRTLGSAVGRVAKDKVTGCLTTAFVVAVGMVVYLLMPPPALRYFEVTVGAVYAAIGLTASRRGVSILVFFLPLWLVGLAMAAVGCWHAWGRWGLVGSAAIGALAIVLVIRAITRALRADEQDAGERP